MALTFSQGGVYGVSLLGTWDDAVETRNVFQFQKTDPGTISEEFGLDDIEGILGALLAYITAVLHIVQVFRGFQVYRLEGDPAVAERTFGSPITGAIVSADPCAPGVAVLSYFNTGIPRRQLRKYFGGLAESAFDADGNINATVLAAHADLAGNLIIPWAQLNGTWQYGGYQTGVPGSFVAPESAVTTSNPSYQRRRRRGRGI